MNNLKNMKNIKAYFYCFKFRSGPTYTSTVFASKTSYEAVVDC